MPNPLSASQVPVTVPPAARLSEEAMDLVCAFVREDDDDRQMANTLCALARTSRCWTSSAVRTLFYDPTRSLGEYSSVVAAFQLQRKLLKKPGLGAYARSLDRLPALREAFVECGDDVEELQADVFVLSLVRNCPNLVSISVPPTDNGWGEELARLPHLRHLTVTPSWEDERQFEELLTFVSQLELSRLGSLTLREFRFLEDDIELPRVELELERLELVYVEAEPPDIWQYFLIHPVGLRHLRILPYSPFLSPVPQLLPPSLTTLDFAPVTHRIPVPATPLGYLPGSGRFTFPFDPFPSLPNLQHLTLEFIMLDLAQFADLAKKCPRLETLSLGDATWEPDEWFAYDIFLPAAGPILSALAGLPALAKLDFGWLPCGPGVALARLTQSIKELHIDVVAKTSFPPLDDDEDSLEDETDTGGAHEGSISRHVKQESIDIEAEHGASSSSPSSSSVSHSPDPFDDSGFQGRSLPSPLPPPVLDPEHSEDHAGSSDEEREPYYLWGFGPAAFESLRSHSPWTPSPGPEYVAEKADEARLEAGYEAEDPSEEEVATGGVEGWSDTEEGCSWEEADRRWMELEAGE